MEGGVEIGGGFRRPHSIQRNTHTQHTRNGTERNRTSTCLMHSKIGTFSLSLGVRVTVAQARRSVQRRSGATEGSVGGGAVERGVNGNGGGRRLKPRPHPHNKGLQGTAVWSGAETHNHRIEKCVGSGKHIKEQYNKRKKRPDDEGGGGEAVGRRGGARRVEGNYPPKKTHKRLPPVGSFVLSRAGSGLRPSPGQNRQTAATDTFSDLT
ncbi:hypothetical protein F5148DRAFT_1365849 [Russula earlei]|uniref:Uncharacterized protein n=1 Tax=Russula earlei TaxID=71964 RepID=A0ACC0UIX3_9AGAM|nr:hypothetical protein F5148DRAFT_1365849 [Russula earlei]